VYIGAGIFFVVVFFVFVVEDEFMPRQSWLRYHGTERTNKTQNTRKGTFTYNKSSTNGNINPHRRQQQRP
jgi:hypothetical protein